MKGVAGGGDERGDERGCERRDVVVVYVSVCVNGVRSRKGGNLERRNLERGNLKEIDSSSSSVYMVYIVRGVGGSNSRSFVILSLGRNRVLLAGLST